MSEVIEQRIMESLKQLPLQEQQEVLDFAEFLAQRTTVPVRDPEAIERLCGKYRDMMTSSDEFARRKQEEIELEEIKWRRS
jgi:hypothetical protein